MKIFITGATGFIGSNLVKKFVNEGFAVSYLKRNDSTIPDGFSGINSYYYVGEESIELALKEFQPSVVIHLATYYSFDSKPLKQTIESNITLGTELLEAMAKNGVKKFINVGTSFEHYQNEDYNPVNLYAATKHAFQKIIDYYVFAHDFQVITLKLFDTYGENDNRKKLLWYIKNCLQNEKTLDFTPGEQKLDFTHISDIVEAFNIVIRNQFKCSKAFHKIYGVNSGEPISLKCLIDKINKTIGRNIKVNWGAKPYREREVLELWKNFCSVPDWKPKISLDEGLKKYFGNDHSV